MPSKVPITVGLVCQVASFILLCIGCSTGFWYVSGGDGRKFQNIGLWKVCFEGFEYWSDYIGKAYYGCWWIFHKEYWYIHEWLLPSWFIATQVMMVFASMFSLILTIIMVAYFLRCCKTDLEETALKGCASIMIFTTILIGLSVLVFATMCKADRTWMPKPEMNNLGWSFGLTVVSGFFSAFGSIAVVTHLLTIRHEKQEQKRSNVMPPPPKM